MALWGSSVWGTVLEFVDQPNLIHEGPQSLVFRARLPGGEPVIVKMTRDEHPAPRRLAAARREYDLLRSVTSESVVRPLGLRADGHRLALLLEDFGGISLRDLLKPGELVPLERFFTVALDLAGALAAVHAAGIVHLDVKPANVIVHPESWRAKLIDFNHSSMLARQTRSPVHPRHIAGSLPYISPEQTGRVNRPVDRRSDLYSLGLTLYELLCGRPAFAASSPAELVHCHLARLPAPARDLRSDCPEALSAIIALLLAKSADDRYQSAIGLHADLQRALESWRAMEPAVFPLRAADVAQGFVLSSQLYGRAAEEAALLEAFDRAAAGRCELLLVTGSAGIGKSALIREARRALAGREGFFIEGKFDQYRRNVPYESLVQAFRQLVQQLLAEEPSALAAWRSAVADACGANGQALVDVIPELELLIGPQPELAPLSPGAALNRFGLVFGAFIAVFARPAHPLVLFLDDLQWADAASLRLLQLLATDAQDTGLLVIGAYRPSEVDANHRLSHTVDAIKGARGEVRLVELGPLDEAAVAAWIRASFGGSAEEAAHRAALLVSKTGGNPFFVTRFLASLHEDGLLTSGVLGWTWDDAGIGARDFTQNVIGLVTLKLGTLPGPAQELIQLAACLGSSFSLRSLAVVSGATVLQAGIALQPAVAEQLLLPLDDDHRLLAAWDERELGPVPDDFDCTYRFLHDRVQQAAYASIPEARRERVHLVVGRRLRNAAEEHLDDQLFEIVDHLNAAAAAIADEDELSELAAMNLRAARKARQSAAYGPACNLLDAACAILARVADPCSGLERDLLLERGINRAQLGLGDGARGDFEAALALSSEPLDRAGVRMEWIQGLLYSADHLGVLEQGLAALRDLGLDPPGGVGSRQAEGMKLLASTTRELTSDGIRALERLPPMDDRVAVQIAGVLAAISPSAHMTNETEQWFVWVAFRGLELFQRHGNTAASAHGYSLVGMTLCGMGDVERGYAFLRLGVDVAERFADPVQLARTTACLGFYQALRESHRGVAEAARRAWRSSLEAGDWFHAEWAAVTILRSELHSGDSLSRLREDAERCGQFLERRSPEMAALCAPMIALVDHLGANGEGTGPYEAARSAWFEEVEALDNEALRVWTQTVGLLALLLDGRYAEVGPLARRIWPRYLVFRSWGDGGELHFIHGMAEAMHALESGAPLAEAEEQLAGLTTWAEESPAAYGAKAELLAATITEARDGPSAALNGYLRAEEQARVGGTNHVEALAGLGAARVQESRGHRRYARLHRLDARQAWLRWGAVRLAEGILPELDGGPAARQGAAAPASWWAPGGSAGREGSAVDLETVLRAADAIASKIDEGQLLRRVLELAVENAGADAGALVLRSDKGMRVRGRWVGGSGGADRFEALDRPLEESPFLSVRVVHYVLRTGEPVVVDRVADDPRFARDPYLVAGGVQSLLALPLRRGGAAVAVLVLENRLAPAAFTPARIRLLTTLSSHMAIALDNARLMAEIQRARDEAVARGEDLAGEVISRGRALAEAEQLHSVVLEALLEGVCGLDADGRILLANPAAHALLGTSEERGLVGAGFHETFHVGEDEASAESGCPLCDAPGSRPPFETRFRRLDGTVVVVECAVRRMPEGPGGVLRVVSFRDVGRRKELEEQLLQSKKIEAVGQFVAGVAHEFNNLLTPLLGHISWLRAVDEGHTERQRALADMEGASSRAAALVKQLLAFGRSSSLSRAPVDIVEVAAEVVRLLSRSTGGGELRFDRPDQDLWVFADVQQVHQVLHNLCLNACEAFDTAGHAPGVAALVQVALASRSRSAADVAATPAGDARPGRFVELLVTDNGPGLDPRTREHLFEPFFTTKPLGRGTGLGLAVVSGIVQQHGGWVTARNGAEGGCEFRVFFPQVDPPEVAAAETTPGPVEVIRRPTVLVVDDEPLVRRVASAILRLHGFHVVEAEDGSIGLEVLGDPEQQVDVVLLDLSMPGLDGWETLAALRDRGSTVPVVLTSGFDLGASPSDSVEERGAQGFLPKPFNREQLVAALEAALAGQDGHDVL